MFLLEIMEMIFLSLFLFSPSLFSLSLEREEKEREKEEKERERERKCVFEKKAKERNGESLHVFYCLRLFTVRKKNPNSR
jgi:hypothetical protein